MVTSRDVARTAGVSQATVSHVLNGTKSVSAEVEARVRRAIVETGYVLNVQAKAMRTSRSGTIGLVTSDIRNPYFPLLLDELTRSAHRAGVKAVVWDDTSADARYALDGLSSGAVDGLILTSARTTSTDIDALLERSAHFVLCNRAPEGVRADVVMADHEGMVRTMVEHLIGAGRRRFAAIYGSAESVATIARRRGFHSGIEAAGISIAPTYERSGPTTYETGREQTLELLDSDAQFDTLVCTSDVLAFGAIDALRERRVRVPDDVWVSGIDGLPMGAWGAFSLTTIEQDLPTIARRSVDRLMARLGGDTGAPVRELVPARLVIRGSTAGDGRT